MKADAHELYKVFGFERQLFAPLFQRPYVWKRAEQWEPLWNDIRGLAERLIACNEQEDADEVKPHFLGAVVLDQFRVPTGKPDARSIIDGQQRLTTVQLFLAAFRDNVVGYDKFDRQVRRLNRLIYNDDVAEEQDRFKVWPTNIDRAAYRAVMTTDDPDALDQSMEQNGIHRHSLIARAYNFYHKRIKDWLDESENDEALLLRIECLTNAVREKIRIVVIDMDVQDDAQAIFETLNARGTPLLPSDLVKNYLFHKAQEEKADLQELHNKYWVEFEEADEFWRGMFGVGHAKRPRIDLFFQHYLTLQKDDEVSVGAVFGEFRSFADDVKKAVDWHLKNLRNYGQHFKRFMEADGDDREGVFFRRLAVMQFTTVYPFLLGLYQATDGNSVSTEERINVLISLESFLVRRMICRLSTRGYNRLFLDMLKELNKEKSFTKEAVDTFLLEQTADSGRWPDEKEFEKAWLSVQIYPAITRPRLKMLLLSIDEGMHSSKTEPYSLAGARGLTVEHLLPQHWGTHWPLEPEAEESAHDFIARRERRDSLLQTFGNLSILTESLNPAVSNGSFGAKKKAILKHSAMNLNRFLQEQESWDEDAILLRGKEVFGVATRLWPHPGTQGGTQ